MSSYCAISPRSSAPWLRRRATTSSMSSTANMMRRMSSVFAGALSGSALTAGGVWNFASSIRPWPPHHGDVGTDVVEPDDLVDPRPLVGRLAFQLHAQFGEERFGRLEVVDNDENVVHPLNRHRSPRVVGRARRGPSPGERSRSELLDMEPVIQLVSALAIACRR